MYVPMYVFFSYYERGRRPSEFKIVPYDSPVNSSTLLRHEIIGMRCLTNAWRVILAPIGHNLNTSGSLHVLFTRITTFFEYCAGGLLR